MKDLCLIPSNSRPEFLHVTLEHILKADGGKDKEVWIAQDKHHSDLVSRHHLLTEVRLVANSFKEKFAGFRYLERNAHSYVGNPYNFLELYKQAYMERDVRYVYLIEDDVLVGEDFFRWHEAVQEKFKYELFCSVAWHCTRNKTAKQSNDPNAVIQSPRDFTSVGVCWARPSLQYLTPHARVAYYCDLSGYMRANFAANPIPAGDWTEQAGLIMRILMEQRGRKFVVWPELRRCAHIGWNGYHRRNGFQLTGRLDEKIWKVQSIIHSTEAMRRLSPEVYDDIDALLPTQEWKPEDLRVTQRIPFDGSYK